MRDEYLQKMIRNIMDGENAADRRFGWIGKYFNQKIRSISTHEHFMKHQ
ncbi:MAG: hypothetical protein HFH53_05750 [Hespellia sp.]|nr:hypothetical protein [Hespellia sp.]